MLCDTVSHYLLQELWGRNHKALNTSNLLETHNTCNNWIIKRLGPKAFMKAWNSNKVQHMYHSHQRNLTNGICKHMYMHICICIYICVYACTCGNSLHTVFRKEEANSAIEFWNVEETQTNYLILQMRNWNLIYRFSKV